MVCDNDSGSVDCRLLKEWILGDRGAANELLRKYQPTISNTIRRMGYARFGARVGLDDLCQIVALKLVEKFDKMSPKETPIKNFRSWLREFTRKTVMRTIVREMAKKRDFNRETHSVEQWSFHCLPDPVRAQQLRMDIEHKLEPGQRTVFEMCEQGHNQAQIAKRLNVTDRTVRRWVQNIRHQVQPLLI